MPRFPISEAEIIVLAQQIIAGIGVVTSPPHTGAELQTQLDLFIQKRTDATASEAAFRLDIDEKDAELLVLTEMMKSILRDAENKLKGQEAKLGDLGWGARAQAVSLLLPEQPRNLEAPQQGDGYVFLDWKPPVGGGAVSVYKIRRRERPAGAFEDVATSFVDEYTLINQPKGKELEYCVVASNRTGDSVPSNTVMVVL